MRKTIAIVLSLGGLNAGEGYSWLNDWLISYDWGLLIWSLITFFCVLFILKAKAWGPLIQVLEKREKDIQSALEAADKAKADAAAVSKDYDEMINKAQSEAQQIISDSKSAADKIKKDIEDHANKNAAEILDKATKQIQAEKDKAFKEIKNSAVEISIAAASKLLEKNIDDSDNRKFIEEVIDGMGQA